MAVREKIQNRQVKDLIRETLKGITIKDTSKFVDEMEPKEKKKFLEFCFKTYHDENNYFLSIIDALVYPQINFSIRQAANYDEVTFGRATINGIEIVREFFEACASKYEDEYLKDDEKFDKHASFNTLTTD